MQLSLDDLILSAPPNQCGEQMEWVDEFDWDPVAQEQERTLTGGLWIDEGLKRYGRPVTLASNGGAWFPLSTIRALEAMRDQPGKIMLLTLPTGATHYVTWNRVAGAPVEAVPVFRTVNASSDWEHELTLRLITVAPPPESPEP